MIVIKYLVLAFNKFKTKKGLFIFNSVFYFVFLIIVIFIDYLEEIQGAIRG